MNVKEFWRLIDRSRAALDSDNPDGNQGRQVSALSAELDKLEPDEIVSFRDHFWDRMIDLYQWEVWATAFLLGDGCSDDGFLDFRSAVISMGQQVFDAAVQEPDSLYQLADDKVIEDIFFEGFQYVAQQVYEAATGKTIPEPERQHPSVPKGKRWKDTRELERILPKTWARMKGGNRS
jgi:hypothetical protein